MSASSDRLVITRPDDWHVHLRDGPTLQAVAPATARVFARAIVMPNLRAPVTTVDAARAYRDRILAVLSDHDRFEPLMTLYLTDRTSANDVEQARASGFVHAIKYYPAGATTHSDSGVTALQNVYPALAAMEKNGVVLSLHGEVTDSDVDIFDREKVFVDRHLRQIVRDFPALRIVLEHVTTTEGVAFVRDASANIAATITPQHLRYSRNSLLAGGLHPHLYCMPILKRETHREALIAAAISGSPKFFLGTDSAPHAMHVKESAVCGAGCYTAPLALELYAEIFEDAAALDRLEGFASLHGAAFYGLPQNRDTVALERKPWTVPAQYAVNGEAIVPLRAGETLRWRVEMEDPHAREKMRSLPPMGV
ncbi:MAG TPA: dihydroorotase [Casimicrobiaceae bacterium]|jgi:dihydroorotase